MFNIFNRNMNSRADTYLYMLLIVLLLCVICYLQPYFLPLALALAGGVYYFSRRSLTNKDVFLSSYLDNIIRNIERTNHFAVMKLDVGMAVFSKDGTLQWKNELFRKWSGKKNLEGKKPEEILPLQENAFDLLSVKDGEKVIRIEDRYYNMKHCRVQTQEKPAGKNDAATSGLILYLTDITEFELLRQKYTNDKLCLACARFDNYEDVTRGLSETQIASLNGEINELLIQWVAEQHGFICRMNKEQSLIGFTHAAVLDLIEDKFTILDKIRAIHTGNKIPPTASIGISCDGHTLEELMQNANKTLSLALGRGGDQAVVAQEKDVQFFGGTSAVNAKSTRVRARIVAQTIHEQMLGAEKVFVMGHVNEDYDSLGSAIGIAKLALSLEKETHLVLSEKSDAFAKIAYVMDNAYAKASDGAAEYERIAVREEEALKLITPRSMLVLVDHHREALSASKKVLETIPWRVIIDHHRRAEDLIADTVLLYLEPSSSSTSELVTELAEYFNDQLEFTPGEATALYAGIVLDTKNFAVQTGERTFEAAATLRRNGANPTLVRQLFKDDMEAVQLRSRLLASARTPLPGVAVAVYANAPKEAQTTVLTAQLADTLVTVSNICVGLAMAEYADGSLSISARSDGSVNVQVVMEELGGGGHQTVAGAQLDSARAADVEGRIVTLLQKQLEEREDNESNTAARY